MLPDSHDVVTLPAKLAALPIIASTVFVYLVPPEIRPRTRNATFAHGASVPETPVDEYSQPMTREVEIRLSDDLLGVFFPTLDPRLDQRKLYLHLGRPVACATHFGHPRGTFGFVEWIRHVLAFQPNHTLDAEFSRGVYD